MIESRSQRSHSRLAEVKHQLGLVLRRRRGGMRLLQALRVARAPLEFVERRRAARELAARGRAQLAVDPRLGYRIVDAGEIEGLARVLAWSRELREERTRLLPAILAARSGKHRIVFDLLSDDEIARRPELVDFALSPALVAAATSYLGTLPVLRRIGLGLSLPDPARTAPLHSQLFHLDGEDFAQLKLLVNASDVERADGPFTWIDAPATERVLRGAGLDVRTRVAAQQEGGPTTTPRFGDDEVARHIDPREWKRLEGARGSAVLVDTSRCLHFGSRVAAGRERLVFGVVFQRYHLVNESPFNCIADSEQAQRSVAHEVDLAAPPHVAAPRDRALRRMLLTQPRPCAPGTFYPEPGSGAF